MDGDGETFEEILLRADLIERHIRREQLRNHDVTASVAMLAHADALIAADLARGWAAIQAGGGR
jgi:hypothetical protein